MPCSAFCIVDLSLFEVSDLVGVDNVNFNELAGENSAILKKESIFGVSFDVLFCTALNQVRL